jgi:hypothetical protein
MSFLALLGFLACKKRLGAPAAVVLRAKSPNIKGHFGLRWD